MPDDELTTIAPAPAAAPLAATTLAVHPRVGGGLWRWLGGTAIGIAIGVGVAALFAWQGGIDVSRLVTGQPAAPTVAPGSLPAQPLGALNTVEGRVGALEVRLNALDRQASAAAGNAGRAEALLIAFATRRAIERGAPLGYLDDQLKLRFGDALPNAVALVSAGARNPVTLDQLALGLDELEHQAAGSEADNGWQKVRRQISGLFVIHNATPAAPVASSARLAQARLLLREGRYADAINAVRGLAGARTDTWIAAATRYADLQRALDLLETTALLEPRELNDGAAHKVVIPTGPIPMATPQP